jgi:hypothetical protein
VKTQIIQLNQNEDVISVRDKMSWSQARRILLVWPENGYVLRQKLELNLVARTAANMGAQLAAITQDAQVRFYAQQLGVDVFTSLKHALDAQWSNKARKIYAPQKTFPPEELIKLGQSPHPKITRWTARPAARIIFFALSVLALFALGIFILPGAKIILSPQVEYQSIVFDLVADPATHSINYSTKSLPAFTKEVIVEGQDTMPATGSVFIPDKPATGSLQFTNKSDRIIHIPPGTIVATLGADPIRFITTSPDDTSLSPNQSVILAARAVKPGPSGNLAAYELAVIEGNFEPGLSVINPQATSGGSQASVASPGAQDMTLLHQRLLNTLLHDALVDLQSSLPEEDILITPTITNVETLAETFFPPAGAAGNQLQLSLRVKVQSQVVSGTTLRAYISPIMDSYTPQGFTPLRSTLVAHQLSSPTIGEDGKAHWTIRAERQLQANIPPQRVTQLVTGKTPIQASQRLSSAFPFAEQARIILSPKWWPRLPFLPMRIEVMQPGEQ